MNRILTLLSIAALITLTACDPDIKAAKQLEGDWKIKSYTEDGVEIMTVLLNSFTMEFEEYQETEGDFTWTLIGTDGSTLAFDGEYEIKDEGTEIDLSFKSGSLNGETWTLDMSLEGDDVEMSGNVDGILVKLVAERD
ncbi:MAG: hypothetical protein SF053_16460 [Bacteroidia bacterium]|nr:hypothetical protein [Bacteroidia bacterium]